MKQNRHAIVAAIALAIERAFPNVAEIARTLFATITKDKLRNRFEGKQTNRFDWYFQYKLFTYNTSMTS